MLAFGNNTLASGVRIFNDASTFAPALQNALNGTNLVSSLVAIGQYNSVSNTFVATRISVSFAD